MEQKAIMQLLETMEKSAEDMVAAAENRWEEANHPESDNYVIKDLFYEDLRYFRGYRQGIINVLNNIRNYYYEESKNLKLISAALYGESVKEA